jgi:2-methylcitrate dehydratase PrpD
MSKLVSGQLAEVVANIQFDTLPPPVIEQAKLCILDLFGSIFAGIDAPPIQIIVKMAKELGGTPEATIIGERTKTSSLLAAFCNAAAGHVVEMDDLHRASILHPGAPVIPAALAIAEREQRSGKELIQAVVAGYEIAIRIGEAAGPKHYEFWHTTGTCGTFGAAIAAGKLLEHKLRDCGNSW